MKVFVVTICLVYVLSTHAQTSNESTNQNKPTWADKIPERADAPQIDVQYQPDTDLDIGVDDLGMDRDALFADEDEIAEQIPDAVDQDDIAVPELDQNAIDEAAAEKIALEQKAEEQKAEKEKAEREKAEREKAEREIAEKAAQEQRLADERQKELDRLAEEKRIADEAAAKQAIAETALDTQQKGKYVWKRIKNVSPVYPAKAARNKEIGWVSVRVEIDVYGDVVNTRVVDTYRKLNTFNSAALKAVRQWKFDPPVNYGIETNQTKDIKITFEL